VLGHVGRWLGLGLLARKKAPYPLQAAISTRRCEKSRKSRLADGLDR
jgi:hypothetical protein